LELVLDHEDFEIQVLFLGIVDTSFAFHLDRHNCFFVFLDWIVIQLDFSLNSIMIQLYQINLDAEKSVTVRPPFKIKNYQKLKTTNSQKYSLSCLTIFGCVAHSISGTGAPMGGWCEVVYPRLGV